LILSVYGLEAPCITRCFVGLKDEQMSGKKGVEEERE
jgi:hypothetical protein